MLVRSLRSSFIDLFSSTKKHCYTSQGFGAFFGQSCDRDRLLFPIVSEFLSLFFFLFLDFIAISHCVFNNKNNYSTRACWISNNYNHFGAYAPRWLSIISSAPSLSISSVPLICVYLRPFMTLRVVQFSLKIAHLSFSMGPRGSRTYGLRPRLWLLQTTYKLIAQFIVASSKAQHYVKKSCTTTKILPILNTSKFYVDFKNKFLKDRKKFTYLLSLDVWHLVRQICELNHPQFQSFHV